MAAPTTPNLVLDPMFDRLLTPESAARVVGYRLPGAIADRMEALAGRAEDDALTPDERREYAGLIHALDLVALFQLKARRLLSARDAAPSVAPGGAA